MEITRRRIIEDVVTITVVAQGWIYVLAFLPDSHFASKKGE